MKKIFYPVLEVPWYLTAFYQSFTQYLCLFAGSGELQVLGKDVWISLNSTAFLQQNEQNIRSAKNMLHFRELPWMLGLWMLRTSSNVVLGMSVPLNEGKAFGCISCLKGIWQLPVREH